MEQKAMYFGLLHMTVTLLFLLSAYSPSSGQVIVDTEDKALLEKGTRAELPCRVEVDIYAVSWYKLFPNYTEGIILFMDQSANPVFKGGPGYEDGSFDIHDNFSLIIKQVEISDEGTYFCEIIDGETGLVYRNRTDVAIFASPKEPYPVISECKGQQAGADQNCTLIVSATNITCYVEGYYPNINLFFHHKHYKVYTHYSFETYNGDGTLNKSIVANVSASEDPYSCVAANVPGYLGNTTVEIIIQSPPSAGKGPGSNVFDIVLWVPWALIITTLLLIIANYSVGLRRRMRSRAHSRKQREEFELISTISNNTDMSEVVGDESSKMFAEIVKKLEAEIWYLREREAEYMKEKSEVEKADGKNIRDIKKQNKTV